MRIPTILVSVTLLLSACSATSADESSVQTAQPEPTETSTSTAPTTTIATFVEVQVDPLLDALLDAKATVPDFDVRFPETLIDERRECSTTAALAVFDTSELNEMEVEAPAGQVVFDNLNRSDSEELAEHLADCPGSDEIVRALVQDISHPKMHDCVESKLIDLNRTPALTVDLGHGALAKESSVITGFTYSCSQSVLDESFGEHPGGTLGEDRRLAAQALLEIYEALEPSFPFEETCRTRSLMALLPNAWFESVASQLGGGVSAQSVGWFLDNETTSGDKAELDAAVANSIENCAP